MGDVIALAELIELRRKNFHQTQDTRCRSEKDALDFINSACSSSPWMPICRTCARLFRRKHKKISALVRDRIADGRLHEIEVEGLGAMYKAGRVTGGRSSC